MKVILASFAQKAIVPVWGTSNYILHIPKVGTNKSITITPNVGGELKVPTQLKPDSLKSNAAKSLVSKLKKHRSKGSGIAVI